MVRCTAGQAELLQKKRKTKRASERASDKDDEVKNDTWGTRIISTTIVAGNAVLKDKSAITLALGLNGSTTSVMGWIECAYSMKDPPCG